MLEKEEHNAVFCSQHWHLIIPVALTILSESDRKLKLNTACVGKGNMFHVTDMTWEHTW